MWPFNLYYSHPPLSAPQESWKMALEPFRWYWKLSRIPDSGSYLGAGLSKVHFLRENTLFTWFPKFCYQSHTAWSDASLGHLPIITNGNFYVWICLSHTDWTNKTREAVKTSDIFIGMWDAITHATERCMCRLWSQKMTGRGVQCKQELKIKAEKQTSQRPPGKLQTHNFPQ